MSTSAPIGDFCPHGETYRPINFSTPPPPDGHCVAVSIAQQPIDLRDYFAAKALAGFAANPDPQCCQATAEQIAGWAYQWADAMIAARGSVC